MITASSEEIQELIALRGWTLADADAELARACYVHPRSVERWRAKGCKRAAAAKRILAMLDKARQERKSA